MDFPTKFNYISLYYYLANLIEQCMFFENRVSYVTLMQHITSNFSFIYNSGTPTRVEGK